MSTHARVNLFQSTFTYFYRYSNRFSRIVENFPIATVGTQWHKQQVRACCDETIRSVVALHSKTELYFMGDDTHALVYNETYQYRS